MRGHAEQDSSTPWWQRFSSWSLIGSGIFLCVGAGCSNAEGESMSAKKAPAPILADVVQVAERN